MIAESATVRKCGTTIAGFPKRQARTAGGNLKTGAGGQSTSRCRPLRHFSVFQTFRPLVMLLGWCGTGDPMRALTALCIACSIGLHGLDACAQGRGEHDTLHTWYRGLKSPEGEGCCNE